MWLKDALGARAGGEERMVQMGWKKSSQTNDSKLRRPVRSCSEESLAEITSFLLLEERGRKRATVQRGIKQAEINRGL